MCLSYLLHVDVPVFMLVYEHFIWYLSRKLVMSLLQHLFASLSRIILASRSPCMRWKIWSVWTCGNCRCDSVTGKIGAWICSVHENSHSYLRLPRGPLTVAIDLFVWNYRRKRKSRLQSTLTCQESCRWILLSRPAVGLRIRLCDYGGKLLVFETKDLVLDSITTLLDPCPQNGPQWLLIIDLGACSSEGSHGQCLPLWYCQTQSVQILILNSNFWSLPARELLLSPAGWRIPRC